MSVGIVITPLNEEALDLLCGEGAVKAVKRWGGHVDQAVVLWLVVVIRKDTDH